MGGDKDGKDDKEGDHNVEEDKQTGKTADDIDPSKYPPDSGS